MSKLIMVALGGAIGAIARYWLGNLISSRLPMQFPMGTFVINVTGSFVIGFFLTLVTQRITIHPNWRLLIAVGFVGAYTTFSTFEFETLKLIEEGSVVSAALNVILSFALGFMAVWLGVTAARKLYIPRETAVRLQEVIAELSMTNPELGVRDDNTIRSHSGQEAQDLSGRGGQKSSRAPVYDHPALASRRGSGGRDNVQRE